MKLYYLILIILYTAFSVALRNQINISIVSILPFTLMLLSILHTIYFHNHRSKKDFNINNDSPLTEKEWEKVAVYMRNFNMTVIPLYIPFIVFFPSPVKTASLILYFIGFAGGMLCFRLRYNKEINRRMSDEETKLTEQKKREELGKWK